MCTHKSILCSKKEEKRCVCERILAPLCLRFSWSLEGQLRHSFKRSLRVWGIPSELKVAFHENKLAFSMYAVHCTIAPYMH